MKDRSGYLGVRLLMAGRRKALPVVSTLKPFNERRDRKTKRKYQLPSD